MANFSNIAEILSFKEVLLFSSSRYDLFIYMIYIYYNVYIHIYNS